MLEKDVVTWFNESLKGFDVKIQRIESPTTGVGIPDEHIRTRHISAWIEFKIVDHLTEQITIPYRPGQFSWLMNHVELNGDAFLVVGHERESYGNCVAIFKNEQIQREYSIPQFINGSVLYTVMKKHSGQMILNALHSGVKECNSLATFNRQKQEEKRNAQTGK